MTGKIFLSYRREDAAGLAQALFGQLEQSFPAESLFMDVDRIGAGQDFVRVIEEQVRACDAMLVLIGPNWLTVKDENGQQRLENSEDFVRVEVESALKFDKRVIPVLVQKTEMPRADALPVPLKALSRRNALGLTQERFKSDAHGLIKALEDALAEVEDARRQAETVATAAEARRAAEEATRIEAAARAEKERARLKAIAGLSPEQIAKAEELVNWDFIKDGESSEEFRDHLARFPDGLMKRQARARLESLVWAGLRQPVDAEALKGFLKEFPEGTRAREANAKLAEFEAQAEAAREAAEREKREMGAWASASADGAVEALEDFQRDWHRSKYADAARKRISEIKGAPWRRWLLLGVGVIAAAAAFLEFQPGSWPPPYDESARTFAEPTGSVDSVAFSPDGRTALSGGYALKLWEVATGKDVRSFSGGDTRSVAFSPDGRTALSGGYHTLILWDVATGKELRSFSGGDTSSVAFSPDGRTALSGGYHTLSLWDVATGKEIRMFAGHDAGVNSVAFSPDGLRGLSGSSDGTLSLWDVATGKEIRSFAGSTFGVNSVAFSPDGLSALSGSSDDTLKLWEVATGEVIHSFTGHTDRVNSVAFSPDGRTALSGSDDWTLKLWDIETGKEIRSFTGHSGWIRSVAFSPAGRIALSGSHDKTLKLWDLSTGH